MAAVEEAWRRTVEAKSSNLANILAQCHLNNSASSSGAAQRSVRIASSSAASPEEAMATSARAAVAPSSPPKTAAAPTSPSIEERKQRIERLRMERLDMKMRLENSRANNAPRRELASKKKSLRWADANGDKLSVASNYFVSVDRPTVSDVPPPLPEAPAPTEIPARFLDI